MFALASLLLSLSIGLTSQVGTLLGREKYHYGEVLSKSILFYDAQRSGKLPANQPVAWRGDSHVDDHGINGEDLSGGWYDGYGTMKFGLPMASSATLLGWGFIKWKEAYEVSGQLLNMYSSLRWALDYFLKAHTRDHEFYVQVGNVSFENNYWGRPEDEKSKNRPAYRVTEKDPGSDVCAETAAALAAGFLVFKDVDPLYASKLLQHAVRLFDFAYHYLGVYSQSVPEVANYYRSTGYQDELTWGALWLYMATKNATYLSIAKHHYQTGYRYALTWEDKKPGNDVLLFCHLKKDPYKSDVQNFLNDWLPNGSLPYTPKGLAYRNEWGSLHYAANTALIALVAADCDLHPDTYRKFAESQINYILGDSGRSFVVGFGHNPPQQPQHGASSCPDRPSKCGWTYYSNKNANPQMLYGAVVGGPDNKDNFVDSRTDYKSNAVELEYNAGFQSAVAGLKYLAINNMLP